MANLGALTAAAAISIGAVWHRAMARTRIAAAHRPAGPDGQPLRDGVNSVAGCARMGATLNLFGGRKTKWRAPHPYGTLHPPHVLP